MFLLLFNANSTEAITVRTHNDVLLLDTPYFVFSCE